MLRPEDFVARFGGDEFVVFQQNIKSPDEAAALARRVVDHLSERYKIDNHLVEIGASVGIAMTSPAGISADTLLKNADMALYRAKADGRGTFCFFRDEMAQTVEARRILELDLRRALATRSSSCSISRSSICSRDRYRPAKRCCDGIIRRGARFRRSISFRSPRTWA